MDLSAVRRHVQQTTALVASGALLEALGYLNGLTEHRYTAIYIRDGDRAWNALLFDAEHAFSRPFLEVAAHDTYCSIAISSNQAVVIADSLQDDRTVVHAARDLVRSYCGAPLYDSGGQPFGTLCHFDARPVPTVPMTAELLVEVGRVIGRDEISTALVADVERRLERVSQVVASLPEELRTALDSGAALEQLMDSVLQIVPRLDPATAASVAERIGALRVQLATG